MKRKFLLVPVLVLAVLFGASTVWAEHDKKGGDKQCSMKDGKCATHGEKCGKSGCEKDGSHQCPITAKFMKKAHFFVENASAIGLSEEQLKTIKDLKLQVKKDDIAASAWMQTYMLDLENKLSEDAVDVEGLNKMVDDGSATFSSNAKASIQAYAKLKSTLTPEQMAKAKEIWKSKK